MRLYAVLTTVFAAAVHASDYGTIYTLQRASSQPPPATNPPLSLHDEQTFYAMRLGFRGSHLLHGVSDLDAMVDLLNQAAPPDALYSDSASAVRRSMFVVEGTTGKDVFPKISGRWDQVAQLAEEPSADYGRSLIKELVSLASSHRGYTRNSPCRTKQKQQYSSIIEGVTIGPDTYGECSVKLVDTSSKSEYIPSALQKSDKKVFREGILDFFHYNSSSYSEEIIRDILKEAASEETREITVLVLPAGLPSGKEWSARRGDTHMRREFSEEPMEAHRPSPTPASMKKPIFQEDSNVVESVPVSATQPRCATSKKACESRTNNCSGRGSCVVSRQKCWSCTCEATKESWGMAYWGGVACQKRDISVQFWLFAGFAIAATATVTWGIGMLYSMGDQDLPSVLGAGVAPTLRK